MKTHPFQSSDNCVNKAIVLYILLIPTFTDVPTSTNVPTFLINPLITSPTNCVLVHLAFLGT